MTKPLFLDFAFRFDPLLSVPPVSTVAAQEAVRSESLQFGHAAVGTTSWTWRARRHAAEVGECEPAELPVAHGNAYAKLWRVRLFLAQGKWYPAAGAARAGCLAGTSTQTCGRSCQVWRRPFQLCLLRIRPRIRFARLEFLPDTSMAEVPAVSSGVRVCNGTVGSTHRGRPRTTPAMDSRLLQLPDAHFAAYLALGGLCPFPRYIASAAGRKRPVPGQAPRPHRFIVPYIAKPLPTSCRTQAVLTKITRSARRHALANLLAPRSALNARSRGLSRSRVTRVCVSRGAGRAFRDKSRCKSARQHGPSYDATAVVVEAARCQALRLASRVGGARAAAPAWPWAARACRAAPRPCLSRKAAACALRASLACCDITPVIT
jgi:hypothetical protein